ncbi:MAG: hypothetical protein WD898_02280 [Candidatus Paceibacterota bacterium]
MSKKYHIYFHNDFDGVTSAAVLLNFFKKHGGGLASYNPIDYAVGLKENWPNFKLKQPSIIVDFLYHPKVTWWFDHHTTSFIKEEWRKEYKNDETHYFDPELKSCCGTVLRHLKKEYKYKPPKHIADLVRWADKIDGGVYASARQAVIADSPARKLSLILREHAIRYGPASFFKHLVEKLSALSLAEAVKAPRFDKIIKKNRERTLKSLKTFNDFSEVHNKVILIDSTKTEFPVSHYMGYLTHPEVSWSVLLNWHDGFFHVSVGRNHWVKRKVGDVHIGKLLSKYGGGGHKNVGGFEKKSKQTILKNIKDIIKYLNKNG